MHIAGAIYRAAFGLRHLLTARGDRWLHSPFVYRFYRQVLAGRAGPALGPALTWRQQLRAHRGAVTFADYGRQPPVQRRERIRRRAQLAGASRSKMTFLHLLTQFLHPPAVLELGTNLGQGTAAMATALPPGKKLLSVDAAAELQALPREAFPKLLPGSCTHPEFYCASFQDFFAREHHLPFHLVYLDGHHQFEPSQRYLQTLLQRLPPQATLVLDDIYWSPGMTAFWRWARQQPRVTVSIDLFHSGVLFLDRPQAPEAFRLVTR